VAEAMHGGARGASRRRSGSGTRRLLRRSWRAFETPAREPTGYICFERREPMGMGRGILLWLLGVPLPIVILLALFWHH
jgi:hypothetical protein